MAIDYVIMEKDLNLALSYDPNNIPVMFKLCTCLYAQHKYQEMKDLSFKIRSINSRDTNALFIYAIALMKLGQINQATEALKQVINEKPDFTDAISALASLYFEQRNLSDAEKYYSALLELTPNNTSALYQLCRILYHDRTGIDSLTRAVELAHKLIDLSDDVKAVAYQVQQIALAAVDLKLQDKLGNVQDLFDYWVDTLNNKPFVLQKSRVNTMADRISLFEAHCAWGEKMEDSIDKAVIKRKVRQRLNNKVRLGISSSDFRSNHVGYYIWPLIEHLDRDKFEIYCYSQWPEMPQDALQERIKSIVNEFVHCDFSMDMKQVAQTIADDSLDVIIEISSWFIRPQAIAYKPAPIQISWLDYAHSMGLPSAIDYLVVDPYVMPENQNLIIEKPLILPETWIVMGEDGFPHIPITTILPEERNGYITFGVMNASYRLTENVFQVWAGIMKVLPNSKIIYIRPETIASVVQDNFCKYMLKYGIAKDRISFIAINHHHNFMEHYNKIDIALDTFPHMGATTTCYTLWMGLPLVTLVGPCFFERLGYSALMNCGLGELCAFSLLEYHNIALDLARNLEKRRYIRHNLRNWIINGPLGQGKRFADNMGNAILNIVGQD